MSSGWIAAGVRARAMARRRLGSATVLRLARAPSLGDALGQLAGTAFDSVSAPGTSLRAAEHGIRAEILWELRVLAGWLPSGGTSFARMLVARFEQANIERHLRELTGTKPAEAAEFFELGTLATSWHRLAATSSVDQLRAELTASPWGDPGEVTATGLHDALTFGWLRMLTALEPTPTVRWASGGAALVAARIVVVQQRTPEPELLHLAAPLIGREWAHRRTVADLRDALPSVARWALGDTGDASQLWRAEAAMRTRLQADGFRLLRTASHGRDVVLGAAAVLAVDGWRLRAALASAATGNGPSEVFDVVA